MKQETMFKVLLFIIGMAVLSTLACCTSKSGQKVQRAKTAVVKPIAKPIANTAWNDTNMVTFRAKRLKSYPTGGYYEVPYVELIRLKKGYELEDTILHNATLYILGNQIK